MGVDPRREVEPGRIVAAPTGLGRREVAAMLHRSRSRLTLRLIGLGLALCLGPVLGAGTAAAAPRFVSINLCTDQLLLSLADPDQILGLSPYARDAVRSWAAERAADFPILSGTAEEIIVLRPDIVLAGRFTKRATRELVRAQGFRIVEFDAPRSIEQAKAQIGQAGALVGRPERAQAAIARIDAAIARARGAATSRSISVLPLQRRGWISGGETLMTSLLGVVGLTNAGAEFSRGFGRQVTLEAIVRLKPDLLLVSQAGETAEDQGSALLQHPALKRLYSGGDRLTVPERLTVCGGPMLAEAIDLLAAAIERR
jgi:iron complex transport system substrate-binding protein